MFDSFTPIHARVLVRLDERITRSTVGIFIPERSQKSEAWGVVCACGSETRTVKDGMAVLIQPKGGTLFIKDGREFVVVHEKEILAMRDPLNAEGAA